MASSKDSCFDGLCAACCSLLPSWSLHLFPRLCSAVFLCHSAKTALQGQGQWSLCPYVDKPRSQGFIFDPPAAGSPPLLLETYPHLARPYLFLWAFLLHGQSFRATLAGPSFFPALLCRSTSMLLNLPLRSFPWWPHSVSWLWNYLVCWWLLLFYLLSDSLQNFKLVYPSPTQHLTWISYGHFKVNIWKIDSSPKSLQWSIHSSVLITFSPLSRHTGFLAVPWISQTGPPLGPLHWNVSSLEELFFQISTVNTRVLKMFSWTGSNQMHSWGWISLASLDLEHPPTI